MYTCPLTTLWVVNDTADTLVVESQQNKYMKQWKFEDVPPRTCKKFTVQYGVGLFHYTSTDKGEVVYSYQQGLAKFSILACWDKHPKMSVDWAGVDPQDLTVFPPANQGNGTCSLGWLSDGTVVLLVQDKVGKTSDALRKPLHHGNLELRDKRGEKGKWLKKLLRKKRKADASDSVSVPSDNNSPMPAGGWENRWMEIYADVIGDLTISQLTLPCTHDSGTYCSFSPYAQQHAKTQNLPISQQLGLGIRVLDLGIGQYEPGNYIISNGIFRTTYTLDTALNEVMDFVDSTSKEIVVLDFHGFDVLTYKELKFDYDALKAQVYEKLNQYYIPSSAGMLSTLQEIWQLEHPRRVVVAWNGPSSDDFMWPPVKHHKYDTACNVEKLHDAIQGDLEEEAQHDRLWSMGVLEVSDFLHTPYENAKEICPAVDNWFHGCSKWALEANIISCDFFNEFSHLVVTSVCANLLKGHGIINPEEPNPTIRTVQEFSELGGEWEKIDHDDGRESSEDCTDC